MLNICSRFRKHSMDAELETASVPLLFSEYGTHLYSIHCVDKIYNNFCLCYYLGEVANKTIVQETSVLTTATELKPDVGDIMYVICNKHC